MRRCALFVMLVWAVAAQSQERWQLQSNFWVNAHQTILYAAQNGKGADPAWTIGEQTAWRDALEFYRIHFLGRSPVFDEELIRINDTLTNTPASSFPEGLDEAFVNALKKAAAVYRRNLWPADDRANRFWISMAQTMLKDAGDDLADDHSKVYGLEYPARIRVDVAPYAGEFGAYTTAVDGFVHTTISSRDPSYQGFAALEMLLHEGSHAIVGANSSTIGLVLTNAARERRLLLPRQLWHALLFYTSGELTRRALAARGIEYVPYADRGAMYETAFKNMRTSLDSVWRAYLDGKSSREDALVRIAEATGSAPPPR